jgi:ubiquinone/menaquinone biosynthesis C-methylase UbiE
MKTQQVIKVEESLTPQELAKHLREPEGETGKVVGDGMNKSNYYINTNAFDLLELEKNESILEIGFGNGKLIPEFFKRENTIDYCGVDLSATMLEEASIFNADLVNSGTVELLQGNINQLCYADNTFDKIVTVNTLYFWDKPQEIIQELKRVLKPNGKLVIGIRDKELVKEMPFTKFGFTLYSGTEAVKLLKTGSFKSVELTTKEEPEIEFDNEKYTLVGSFIIAIKQ